MKIIVQANEKYDNRMPTNIIGSVVLGIGPRLTSSQKTLSS